MGLFRRLAVVAYVFLYCFSLTAMQSAEGQAPGGDSAAAGRAASPRAAAAQPRVVRFGGTLVDADNAPRHGVAAITFSLYSEPQGGSPVWVETQNVNLDDNGRYTALLGASSGEGMPIGLFAQGEARWLGVRLAEEGAAEQPRVQLVSVPYALAAADAQSLGGRPASDFQLTRTAAATGDGSAPGVETSGTVTSTTNTVGRIAKFTALDTLGDSVLIESGGNIGIGTVPTFPLHILANSTSAALAVGQNNAAGFGLLVRSGNDNTPAFLMNNAANSANKHIFWGNGDAAFGLGGGRIGIGTSAPAYPLHIEANNTSAAMTLVQNNVNGFAMLVRSGNDNTPAFLMNNAANSANRHIFYGSGDAYLAVGGGRLGVGTTGPTQKLEVAGTIYSSTGGFKFPDGSTQTTASVCTSNCGNGTITGVTAGSGLTGGGTSGAVALAVNLTASGGDGGAATTVARGDHLHDARYLNLTGGSLSGALAVNRTENASSLNEIRFADNGQIRSLDNNHRLIFDRAGNALELREIGDIILSPGASAGNRTSKAKFFADGSSFLTGARGTFRLLDNNGPSNGKVLLNTLTSNTGDGPQERYAVNTIFEFVDVGMDAARNYVIEIQDTPALTVKRDLNVLMPGKIRMGAETVHAALSSDDAQSIVVRRIHSTDFVNNIVVALANLSPTNDMKMVRDGSHGGIKITVAELSANKSVGCMGVTSAGSVVGKYGVLNSLSMQIWTDAQNVVYFQCTFGHPYNNGPMTQITLQREAGDFWWTGTLISTTNQ